MHVARRPPREREVKLASKAKVEVEVRNSQDQADSHGSMRPSYLLRLRCFPRRKGRGAPARASQHRGPFAMPARRAQGRSKGVQMAMAMLRKVNNGELLRESTGGAGSGGGLGERINSPSGL
jgi:hypothetical protein